MFHVMILFNQVNAQEQIYKRLAFCYNIIETHHKPSKLQELNHICNYKSNKKSQYDG